MFKMILPGGLPFGMRTVAVECCSTAERQRSHSPSTCLIPVLQPENTISQYILYIVSVSVNAAILKKLT